MIHRLRSPIVLLSWLASIAAAVPSAAQSPGMRALEVVGTEIRVVLGDGSVLQRERLIGATLAFTDAQGKSVRVRIEDIEADRKDPDGDVLLYRLLTPDAAAGTWRPLCDPGPDGRTFGFPLAGAWDEAGNPIAGRPGAFTIACTSGAIGKCVRFGYKPWKTVGGVRLDRHHAACMRMVRADYGGDGTAFTRDGHRIDVFDEDGVQQPDNDPADAFEAGWAPEGAVCIHHPRVRANVSLAELEARFPRLKGRTGDACTEEFAKANGAIVFNRSAP